MKRIFVPTSLLLLLGLCGCGKVQESSTNKDAVSPAAEASDNLQPSAAAEYAIKFKYKDIYEDSNPGDVAHITDSRSIQMTLKTSDAAGKVLEDKHSTGGETFVFTQSILERPDKSEPPSRVRRRYERAEKKDDNKTTQLGLHGKTVLIEKKNGKWRFHYENGPELALADATIMYREFQRSKTAREEKDALKELLPKKSVKVGETWPVDAPTIAKERQKSSLYRLDPAKASGNGKLLRVYLQDGRQFGVLEFTIQIPIRGLGTDKVDEGSSLSLKVTIEGCIDGTSGTQSIVMEENNTLIGDAPDGKNGKKGKMTMEMRLKRQMVRKDRSKAHPLAAEKK